MKNHHQAVSTYINGNITDFKHYIQLLSKAELIECLRIFNTYTKEDDFKRFSCLLTSK